MAHSTTESDTRQEVQELYMGSATAIMPGTSTTEEAPLESCSSLVTVLCHGLHKNRECWLFHPARLSMLQQLLRHVRGSG